MKLKQSFNQKCYQILNKVPKGKLTTYRAIAHKLNTKAYQAVGNAMNKNPWPFHNENLTNTPKTPCHRVINSNGELGGFASGPKNKIKLLKQEGITIKNNRIDLKKYEHKL
jgi:methylated-DNA-[protein]-cysteine S-methyltransferase|tara:strand:+ start:276 stop:608 length:333 start_codon:yes stop_codon:yes gene_type:complete